METETKRDIQTDRQIVGNGSKAELYTSMAK